MNTMMEALDRLMNDGPSGHAERPPEEIAQDLRKYAVQLSGDTIEHAVGDLVTQREGLEAYSYPKSGYPAIVTELLPKQSRELQAGSNTRVVNMVIGVMVSGDFVEFPVDGRRFESWFPSTKGEA